MYTQTTHVSSVHQFSKPRQSKKWTLGGSVSLLFFFFSLAQQRMFAVSVPDFKVSINCVIFRMCKAACLNAENQTKLCKKKPFNLCNSLSIFLVQMPILHVYICNTDATWMRSYENVVLCRNFYAVVHTISKKKIIMVKFSFKYK